MKLFQRRIVQILGLLAATLPVVALALWEIARPRPAPDAFTIWIGTCGAHWDGQLYSESYTDMVRELPDTLRRRALARITLDDILMYNYDRHRFRLTDRTGRFVLGEIAAAQAQANAMRPPVRVRLCYLGLVNDQPRFAGLIAESIDTQNEMDAPHVGMLSLWKKDEAFFGQIGPYDAYFTDGMWTVDTLRSLYQTPTDPSASVAVTPTVAPYGSEYVSLVLPDSPELFQVLRDSGKLASSVGP